MYILSSIGRLFRCITTLQCGYTREMLQAGIEAQLTLSQSDILPQNYRYFQRKRRSFYVYISTYTLSAQGVLNLWEKLCIYVCATASDSPLKSSNHWGWEAYTMSSIDRLFCCITTLQCGYTREIIQDGIETRLTLRQSDILYIYITCNAHKRTRTNNLNKEDCLFKTVR